MTSENETNNNNKEENYFEYFVFGFCIACWTIISGFIYLIHLIMPFLFNKFFTDSIHKIDIIMQKRSQMMSKSKQE